MILVRKQILSTIKTGDTKMNTLSKPSVIRSITIVLIALVFLGGVSITGAAAQSAIPGDALYSVKTSIEQTRLNLASDASDRATMNLGFAEERLNEIGMLINEGKSREIKNAVLSFEASINSAIIELETVAKGDPARATELTKEITSALTRYAQTLSVLAASAPGNMKDDVIRALDSTNLAGSLDMSSADDNSNVNANANDNGNDNANVNTNENGDDNGNDNANVNANDNGDDHGNDVGNVNSNDDSNMNANNNGDDNTNMNANDNANNNSNSNNNTSVDDNSNSNTNSNDNSTSNTNVDDSSGNSGKGGNDNGGSGNSGKGGG
jgi:hypothetical protein